jgi:hypothetical protein
VKRRDFITLLGAGAASCVAARGARAAARKPGADWSLDRLARKLDQAADAAVGQWTRLGPRRPLSGVPPWSQPVLG